MHPGSCWVAVGLSRAWGTENGIALHRNRLSPDSFLSKRPQSPFRSGSLGPRIHGRAGLGWAVSVAVYYSLGMDAARMGCLQLRGPSRPAAPDLTAVTILGTGQGPGQWLPR